MTARRLANLLGATAIGAGLVVWIMAYVLDPSPLVALVMLGNAAVSIWWGVHVLVTRRPW